MFARWGRFVFRYRWSVLVVTAGALLLSGVFGLGLADRLTQSGYDDPGSESVQAARLADETFGRDHGSDIIALYAAPDGKTVDDPAFGEQVLDSLNAIKANNPDKVGSIQSYWPQHGAALADKEKKHAFARIALTGNSDTETLAQYQAIQNEFDIPGVKVEVSGLQPIGDAIGEGTAADVHRAEIIALPLVAILLFFIFGGVVAALLPVIVGILTIAGGQGAVWTLTHFMEINTFAGNVLTLIGLGLAIDYGLFIVSRFREELAEGNDTQAAVQRTVATAGRTVLFSATLLVVCLSGTLMFPQGFLHSVAFAGIFGVGIAAIASLTVLPAMLALLGKRVDALGIARLRVTKTREQLEQSYWGRLAGWVMKHPVAVAVPIVVGMLLLIAPFGNIKFGGITEKYLPPDNPTRVAQEHFDELFPTLRTDPINLVVKGASLSELVKVQRAANEVPGFTGTFTISKQNTNGVDQLTAALENSDQPKEQIDALRAIEPPDGVEVLVGGTPAITQDSIDAMGAKMLQMAAFVVFVTIVLMFLAFGSLILPIKAVLMSALGLGSTLGLLTWMFIDGNGSSLFDFTPVPLLAPIIPLLLAIVFGLSTDYEVFLLSRMIEARQRGATTAEAIRTGTAQTGRIITAAALILIVVTGAFGFSDIVLMKYIAFGLIFALVIDATVIRMLLVPAVMKLLGDDSWWAPAWMKRIQERIGLGETADAVVSPGK